jgi:hypothetical protein
LHCRPQDFAVKNRAVQKFNVQTGKIALVAGAKIIQHPDSGTPLKMFRQMAPDKPGTTCD